MSISVSNLSKNYGAQKAVNNISFNVGKGEIVGFLGPNGAGKSTTMKMITGYLQPDEGKISVSGIDVAENNIASKKKIGYLPEANPLYAEMYVREYLHFTAGVFGLDNIKQRTEAIFHTVGLSAEANKKIGQLSKGYKQRVGLAAALIHEPEILLLDEPTSGLDPNQIIEIRNLIRSLSTEKTVLFSSHILQEVEAICDRVIIINKGIIVADDLVKNLQGNGDSLHRVNVEFRENIQGTMLSEIAEAENVKQLSALKYQLSTADPEAVRKQLLRLSIENNWNIVSLQNEVAGLEEIFKTLTADPGNS